jgi:uncharacterized protein (DUF1810 family)
MVVDEFAHFVTAQEPVYHDVVQELERGRKTSHWMWFIFPQLLGLGHSNMSVRFGLQDLAQAARYAAHPLLGSRLRECTQWVLAAPHADVATVLGHPDNLKFHSCMTLFARAALDEPLFPAALQKFFAGQPDTLTLKLLNAST